MSDLKLLNAAKDVLDGKDGAIVALALVVAEIERDQETLFPGQYVVPKLRGKV